MTDDILDEDKYVRVTTVLNPFSKYDSVPLPVLNYASDRGTRVHAYCERYATGKLSDPIDADCFEYVQAFINWFDENVDTVIHTEKRLYCDYFFIQGQIDLIAKLRNREGIHVVDIKTALLPSKAWPLQLAAYQYLAQSNYIEASKRLVVHVKKTGEFTELKYPTEPEDLDFTLFKSALSLYRHFS